MRSYSVDLRFRSLTLAGTLALTPSDGSVTLWVDSFNASGGGVSVSRTPCQWADAPDLTLVAAGAVTIGRRIDLIGRHGVSVTSTATCNSCDGSAGGIFTVQAGSILVNDVVDVGGGGGASMNFGNNIVVGCDGGDGGNVRFAAVNSIQIGAAAVVVFGGDPGMGTIRPALARGRICT